MSFPFGDHPQFGHFKQWCRENDIEVRDGVMSVEGRSIKVTTFISGVTVVAVSHILDREYITPTQLGALERRLGVNTHWFSVDREEASND